MAKRAPSRALFDEKERKSSSSSSLLSGLIDEQKEEENERDFFLLSFFLFSTPTPPFALRLLPHFPSFSSLIEIINRRNSAFTHEKEEKNKKRQERKKGSKKRKQKKKLSSVVSLPSSLSRVPFSSILLLLRVRALLLAHADDDVDEAAVVLDALHGATLGVVGGRGEKMERKKKR